MAIINKHGSWKWSATIPLNCGDRYWSQDKIRDFQYLRNLSGDALSRMFYTIPALISGGIVTQTAINTVTISPAIGLVKFSTTIPNTFAAIPPSTTTADVVVLVQSTQQTQLAVTAGSSTNYVKLKYLEADGNTRVRSKKAGTYAYENTDSFQFVINNVSPTDYDLVLASFTNSGGTFTIQQYPCTALLGGNGNCAFGDQSLRYAKNTENVAIGFSALSNLISGSYNCATGSYSLSSMVTASDNTACGKDSLRLSSVSHQCAFGSGSLRSCTTAVSNSAFGYQTLYSNVIGNENCAFGREALRDSIGSYNSAFGAFALQQCTGALNSAFGQLSLTALITGNNNSAFGALSLTAATSMSEATAVGAKSLALNQTGVCNTAIGYNALCANTNDHNTAVGHSALSSEGNGYNNTAVGFQALASLTTGYSNTAIGYSAGFGITTFHHCILLGYGSTATASGQCVIGDSSISDIKCATTTITTTSDGRDKADIENFTIGLDAICAVFPKKYKWDKRSWYETGKPDGSKKENKINVGFIAQDFLEVEKKFDLKDLRLVKNEVPDELCITPGNLLPVLINAIKELAVKVENIEQRIK